MAALLRLLPERDSHPRLHDAFAIILDSLDTPEQAGALYVRFELAVLEDLGFGLDLSACAATGVQSDLIYVSPKSGRAVSAGAGAPGLTGCWPYRRSCPIVSRSARTPRRWPRRFDLPGIFSIAMCSSRAESNRRSAARVFARLPCAPCRNQSPLIRQFRGRQMPDAASLVQRGCV